MAVGKIAMPAPGHQEFLPRMRCMIYDSHLTAPSARGIRTHQPGCSGSDNDNICQHFILFCNSVGWVEERNPTV